MRVKISAGSFMEYSTSGQRGRIAIVSEQKAVYLSEHFLGQGFYEPVRDAMRRAANSATPELALDAAIDRANRRGQAQAFVEIKNGYLPWLASRRATGVPVVSSTWSCGDLVLTIKPHLGLRLRDGSTMAVLAYLKSQPLTQESANVGLRLLEYTIGTTLPEATPIVLDARRGRAFSMSRRTNTAKLDALIIAEAAGYVAHWGATA
ncbi:hypothetical protein [Umezawaea tangerina]|uniref:Uncharacterized protein n=1 Tax=Umezawaea tangerina TaxID=84725 RepID=A0A2T0SVF0_9PSEU|nr:hypothetical protein [Umezawaea tangerina]PRY37386.1 hypothetical protein CLV43_110197 [Umezawaea tangerina]